MNRLLDGDFEVVVQPEPNRNNDIALNFKRMANTSRKCIYPACDVTTNLIRPDKQLRYNIMVHKKLYVPARAKVCITHNKLYTWAHLDTDELNPLSFTLAMVEDLIELLIAPARIRGFMALPGKAEHTST